MGRSHRHLSDEMAAPTETTPATQNMQNATSTNLDSTTPTQNHVEEIPMMVLAQETPKNEGENEESGPRWKKYLSECNDVDRQWSWVVLVICFIMFMLGNGAQFAFGVMYSSIRRYFNTSKATTSWILLLQRGTGSFFGKKYSDEL